MQMRNLLLAAALVALPATLHAQPVNGWYVGGGLGVNDLLAASEGTGKGKLKPNVGGVGLASVGYGYGNGLRAEVEMNFRAQTGKDSLTNAKDNTKSWGPMINALYDIDLGGGVYPYLGAGIGAQWMDASAAGRGTSNAQAAAQGIVGLAIPVAQNLSVTAEARVLAFLGDAKFGGGKEFSNPTNISGLIGLRYAFGAPAAPAAAPAPAPAPAPAMKAEEARTYLVFFDWDKSDLTARARQIIADAAGASQRLAVTRIEVAGHADKSGTAAYNQALSLRRADAVAAELVRLGVKKDAIAVSAFGDTKPLVPTADGVREPQNRRVEIVLK